LDARLMFPPNRAEGLARLDAFVPRAGSHYAANRNADLGPGDRSGVSVLSPYIRHRIVTEDEVVAAVLKRHRFAASEKYVQEVLWRTYWKGWLEMRPAVWTRFLEDRDRAMQDAGRNRDLDKALAGATGIEGFDDWVRELIETGYLHNHARMWFASIWIFTLRLPWALGADFFLRHLIDADPASNTLSWRWVAGLQTVGKTYLASTDNIARYTSGRFAPTGLATRAEALVEAPVPAPSHLRSGDGGKTEGPALLLITGEDLHPETALLATDGVAGIVAPRTTPGWPFGEKATAFVEAATAETLTRTAKQFGCDAQWITGMTSENLIAAAQHVGTRTIITPFAPVGPVADQLAAMRPQLAAAGIALIERQRAWDATFWPHAKKGFFPFKEKIPAGLAGLGLL
jgi:deoxyribodipyrimidine photo-lyase